MRAVWRIVSVIVAVVVLGIGIAVVMARVNHGQLRGIQTSGMAPELKRGDLVMVKDVPTSSIQAGDVVTFTDPDTRQVLTQRVIGTPAELGAGNFQTKGDANVITETFIPESAIIGRVSYAVPYLGFAAEFLRRPVGLTLLIGIPVLFLLVAELRHLIRRYREREASYTLSGYDHGHNASSSHQSFRHPYHHAKLFLVVLLLSMLYVV